MGPEVIGFRVVSTSPGADLEVWELVRSIPPGTVASYGRLAEWLGRPLTLTTRCAGTSSGLSAIARPTILADRGRPSHSASLP